MVLSKHIGIAAQALEQGIIDTRLFAEIVRWLNEQPLDSQSVDQVWVQSGLLSVEQLTQMLADMQLRETEEHSAPLRSSDIDVFSAPLARGFIRLEGVVSEDSERTSSSASAGSLGSRGELSELTGNTANTVNTAGPSPTVIDRLRGVAHQLEPDSTGIYGDLPSSQDHGAFGRLRYEHKHVLGSGGLGRVTSCYDTVLRRRVALKAPREDHGRRGEAVAEAVIEREARIVASLEHPNIIPVYDAGYLPGVGPYYVMREVTQPSLSQVLRRLRDGDVEAEQTYTLRRLLRIFAQICQAVDFAHNRGVLHCDLKPSNVLLGNFGECLVVDWGLAYSPDAPGGPRGGTPGFMAPEQIERPELEFDPRIDVFSLGAILYTILCLQPPFPELSSQASDGSASRRAELLARYQRPPLRPSEVLARLGKAGPSRELPVELEDVCLAALSMDPAARPASAAMLADAVEEYLEGKRELERRRADADTYAACGDELSERYLEFAEARPEQLRNLAELRSITPPWAPVEDKLDIWNLEDLIAVTDSLRMRTFQAALSAYEQALERTPQHEAARQGMISLYRAGLESARYDRDNLDKLYLMQRLHQYESSRHVREARSTGTLRVTMAANVCARLWPVREEQRRLVRAHGLAQVLPGTGEPLSLPGGSYVIEAWRARPGQSIEPAGTPAADPGSGDASEPRVFYPVRLDTGHELRLALELDPYLTGAVELDADEVLIPGGAALLGISESLVDARPAGEVEIAAFIMQRWPVSFGQYLAFLDDLRRSWPDRVDAYLPRDSAEVPLVRWLGAAWEPTNMAAGPGGAALSAEELAMLPVFGVDVPSAEAYADWLAARTGRPYRLPWDSEWEKAARGTDCRAYPWGDHFDPTFCKMRESRPGLSRPEPPGAFATDESPYGVRDLAGGIADWTLPAADEHVYGTGERDPAQRLVYSRGGAWCDWAIDCRVTVRRAYSSCEHSRRVGFRLVRSP